MKTVNLELVFEDNNNEDINIKIMVKKGGGVDIKTLPTSPKPINTEEKPSTGDSTPEKSKRSTTKKKVSGNLMDLDI